MSHGLIRNILTTTWKNLISPDEKKLIILLLTLRKTTSGIPEKEMDIRSCYSSKQSTSHYVKASIKAEKKNQKLWLKETCFRRMTRRLHIEEIWWIQHFYKTFHTPYDGWPFWNPHLILSTAAKDVWYSFKTLNKFGGHLSRPRKKDAMWVSKTIRPSELPILRLDYN